MAERHVMLALERLGHFEATSPQPRYIAFLLRQAFGSTAARTKRLFLGAGGLRYIWNISPRPSFTGSGTDGAEYAVMVWQAGHRGPYEGGWLEWQPEKKR